MEKSKEILWSLIPLHSKAIRENLWFYCSYQSLWFSPKEIKSEWDHGCFIWGPQNWQLRDPKEYLKETKEQLEENIKNLKTKVISLEARIKNG
jgi:hypothetical protein